MTEESLPGAKIAPKAGRSDSRFSRPTVARTPGQMVWERFRRHPGAVGGSLVLAVLVLGVIMASLSPYDPIRGNLDAKLQPPSWEHPMGTDALGRDLFTRVLYGGRISLTVGLLVVAIVLAIGVTVGSLDGTGKDQHQQ